MSTRNEFDGVLLLLFCLICSVCLTGSHQNLWLFWQRCISNKYDCRHTKLPSNGIRCNPTMCAWRGVGGWEQTPPPMPVHLNRSKTSVCLAVSGIFHLQWAITMIHSVSKLRIVYERCEVCMQLTFESNRCAYPLCACRCMDSATAILLHIVHMNCGWARSFVTLYHHKFLLCRRPIYRVTARHGDFCTPAGHTSHTPASMYNETGKKMCRSINWAQRVYRWWCRCLAFVWLAARRGNRPVDERCART